MESETQIKPLINYQDKAKTSSPENSRTSGDSFSGDIENQTRKIAQEIAEEKINIFIKSPGFKIKIDNAIKETEKDLNKKIDNSKLTVIESLGIFVALFTFISVEFQVFRSYRNAFAISGLSLILLGSISFLLIIFDFYILQSRNIYSEKNIFYENKNILNILREGIKNNPMRVFILFFTPFFILIGICLFHGATNDDFEDMKNDFRKEIAQTLREDLREEIRGVKEDQKEINILNKERIEVENAARKDVDSIKKCVSSFGITYKCFK